VVALKGANFTLKGMAVFRHFNTYNTGLFGETLKRKQDVIAFVNHCMVTEPVAGSLD
jgi:hypothetical protein